MCGDSHVFLCLGGEKMYDILSVPEWHQLKKTSFNGVSANEVPIRGLIERP